ncbi:MAG: hypothetical protein A2Y94_09365 [Caldithrix sp. RBG_13_44_9]|nr:MAG: hypothetical protein A2Y94_09365 [Caldithrix sp. RBG_13_44_9]
MKKWIFIFFTFLLLPELISQGSLISPLEKSGFSRLSSYGNLMLYLSELTSKYKMIKLEIIGQTLEGRDIPALFFSSDKTFGNQRVIKPLVLVFCQQHGDEPSGKEAALILARELMNEKKNLLKSMDLILTPQLNPDGAEKNQRRNARDIDLNRNHIILTEPETQALHQLFLKWMPEVTLDVHEYTAISDRWLANGFIKYADEQLGALSNMNISPVIREFSRKSFLPAMGMKVKAAGFSFHEYIVGTPFENSRLRYSTTAISDGRQSLGIFNTLSFILEGKQYSDVINHIESRTYGQLATITAFLQTVAENSSEILEMVSTARQELLSAEKSTDRIYLQMEYYPDSTQAKVEFPVFNLSSWQQENRVMENFHPTVLARKSISRPLAYIIPAGEKKLIEILSRHRIEMNPLPEKSLLDVEIYFLRHVTTFIEEELEVPYLDMELKSRQKEFPAGSMVIYVSQPAGNLISLLLEPQSSFSLCTESSGQKERLLEYLKENSEYPVYRLTKPVPVLQIKGKNN